MHIKINASYDRICIEFETKNNTTLNFSYFQIAYKYLKSFMTHLLNNIFWRIPYMITRL